MSLRRVPDLRWLKAFRLPASACETASPPAAMTPQPLKRFDVQPCVGEPKYILAAGDVYLEESKAHGALGPGIVELFAHKHLAIVNLECPVRGTGSPISKSGPVLAASEEVIELLRNAAVDVAALANNHIMDFGPGGLEATVAACGEAGVAVVGAGANLEEAYAPRVIDVDGVRIATLAFAQREFNCATATTPGTAPLEAIGVWRAIRRARTQADLLIVSVHAGVEFYPVPTPRIQELYRFIAESGADAVIGHHPHIVQGIEIYDGVPIVYSAGNLLSESSGRIPPCWWSGLLVRLALYEGRIAAVEAFGCQQVRTGNNWSVDLAAGAVRDSMAERFARLCDVCKDPLLVSELWTCFCRRNGKRHLSLVKLAASVLPTDAIALAKRVVRNKLPLYPLVMAADGMNRIARSRKSVVSDRNLLRNFLSCPAHYEVITTALETAESSTEPSADTWEMFDELVGS